MDFQKKIKKLTDDQFICKLYTFKPVLRGHLQNKELVAL
jgi:hypothetical protein